MLSGRNKALARPRSVSPSAASKRAKTTTASMLQPNSEQELDGEYLNSHHRIHKSEYIRLLQQALSDLGHFAISEQVAAATGIVCEDKHIVSLRNQIAQGDWLEACQSIQKCNDVPPSAQRRVQFVLLREYVLEVGTCVAHHRSWGVYCSVVSAKRLLILYRLATCFVDYMFHYFCVQRRSHMLLRCFDGMTLNH
jgi:hypothetical protein